MLSLKLSLWRNNCNKSLYHNSRSWLSLKLFNLNTPGKEGTHGFWSPRWNTLRWWAVVKELKVIRSNGYGWGQAVMSSLNTASKKPLMLVVMKLSSDWTWRKSLLVLDWFWAIRNAAGCMSFWLTVHILNVRDWRVKNVCVFFLSLH